MGVQVLRVRHWLLAACTANLFGPTLGDLVNHLKASGRVRAVAMA